MPKTPTAADVDKEDAAAAKKAETPSDVTESRMHRLRVGDKVSYQDQSDWPPVDMEGTIKEFTNVEGSYVLVEFDGDADDKELTEDEVKRIG